LISSELKSQRYEINSVRLKIHSIDPIAKRVFVTYDYLFESEIPKNSDSVVCKSMSVIIDSLNNYLKCLFKLEKISLFKIAEHARYRLEINKSDYKVWAKNYVLEYNILTKELLYYPALQRLKTKPK